MKAEVQVPGEHPGHLQEHPHDTNEVPEKLRGGGQWLRTLSLQGAERFLALADLGPLHCVCKELSCQLVKPDVVRAQGIAQSHRRRWKCRDVNQDPSSSSQASF